MNGDETLFHSFGTHNFTKYFKKYPQNQGKFEDFLETWEFWKVILGRALYAWFPGLWGGASAQGFIGTFSTVFPTNQQEPNCLVLRFSIDESVKNRSRMADLQARKPSENLHS